MNNATYKAILAAHEQARRVIDARKDFRIMERNLKEEEAELETHMNFIAGNLIGEEIGDLHNAWDHLVDAGRWDVAAHVALLGRDATHEVALWQHRVDEAQRRILE